MSTLVSMRSFAVVALAAAALMAGDGQAAEWALPSECVAAERDAAGKLRALLLRSDVRATWLLGGSLAGLKAARGHCANGQTERALPMYRRVIETLEADEAARAPEVAATPRGPGAPDPD